MCIKVEKNQARIKCILINENNRVDALGLRRKMIYLSACMISMEQIGKKLLNTLLIGLPKA